MSVHPSRRRVFARGAWLAVVVGVLAVGLAVGIVAGVSLLAGPAVYRALGNTDPGVVVSVGTPVLRLLADSSAALCVGALAFGVFFARPERANALSAQGYAAVRLATRWAAVWFVSGAVLLPFDMADTAGTPLPTVLSPAGFLGMLGALEEGKAWLVTVIVAFVVALGCRVALSWRSSVGLLMLAVLGLLPPLCTGHSSSDAGHDVATAAILVHVPVAAVWMGVLAALLAPSLRASAWTPELLRRYRRMAWSCWLLLVLSGLVDAAVIVPPSELISTGYGSLLLIKVVLVGVLGALGALLRRKALPRLAQTGAAPRLLRLAAGELAVLTATVALSVGLTHLPPPAFVGHPVTAQQTLLGYNLAGPPTLLALALDWRFEVLFGSLALVLAAGYVLCVRRLRGQGEHWPAGRTAAWLGGCLVILLATSSGIGRYAAAMFSMHIASHMLLAMLAPLLLVLGGPVTLMLRITAPSTPTGWGPREWLHAVGTSPTVRVLTHPVVALVLFAASPFALYFTGLFDAAVRFHWAHLAIDAYFLAVGYLFAWLVVGIDPLPRPVPNLARLGMLLAAMPFDALFAALLMTTRKVIGNGPAGANMYQALALPWVPNLLGDQRLAGVLALSIGEIALFGAAVVLLAGWFRWDGEDESAEQVLRAHLAQRVR